MFDFRVLDEKYGLNLPEYPGSDQFVEIKGGQ